MYQNCIFDLYGTLVDIRTDETDLTLWEKLALFYGYYGAVYQPEELREAYHRTVSRMERGAPRLRQDAHEAFPEIQLERVFRQLYEEKGAECDPALAIHTGQLFRVLSTRYIRLYDGAKELLRHLKEQGKGVYLLSNAQAIFTRHELYALGIDQLFDGILLSSDYGCKKPDRQFFELLFQQYPAAREAAIMIGNDGVCDIAGAREAGLATLYIHSNISPKEPAPQADYVLDHMDLRKAEEILLQSDFGGIAYDGKGADAV